MTKIRPIKNTWYNKPIRKSVGGFKDKIVSLFKTNTPKQTVYGRGNKLSNPKTQNNTFILKNRIIRDIWALLEAEEEKKK